jgi:CDP-glucose 4,6-dehydratase
MSNKFWYGKNVFITGINGFIAGNLAKILLGKGSNVFGLIRNQSEKSFLYFEGLSKDTVNIFGDILDKDLLCRIISEENINVVFHLAAQVEIGVGMQNPFLTFETNIRGTYNLLEAIRLNENLVESAVFASTDKAYGSYPVNKMPYKENYPLLPKYPYDTSKACADMLTQSYTNEIYKLPLAVTRFSNIYGPGQLNFSALIPSATTSALGFSNFIPRSDGSMIRDFLFVEDVAELYLIIAEEISRNPKSLSGEIFNAGTNRPTTVREVLQKIFFLAGNEKDYAEVLKLMKKKQTKGEISCQYMDFEKLFKLFNWHPKTFLDDGLLKTIEWYKRWNNTIAK